MGFIGSSFHKLEGWIESFAMEVFASVLKPEWIDEVLKTTDRHTERERKLTAPFTVWLLIAMGFYRNLSIQNVIHRMGNLFGVGSLWSDGKTPTSGSDVEARTRLGFRPLRMLAEKFREWILATFSQAMCWKGMLLLALDGTTFKVPDSDENRRRFGLPGSNRSRAAFPQLRALFLVSAKLRFILAGLFAPYRRAEISMALRILPQIPKGSLLLLDKNFNAWLFLLGLLDLGNQFLIRAKDNMHGVVLGVLGAGDRLVRMRIPRALRHEHPSLPKDVVAREISVRIKGKPFRFLTSLTNAEDYSAVELVLLYAQRWQEEIALDEIKTHQCPYTTVNRPVIFRCKASRRVLQEAYGLVLAYNLVRTLMTQAAVKHQAAPLRISFVDSLERIREAALLMAAAPTRLLPQIFEDLLRSIARCLVPNRRRENPRVVCVKMSNYRRKAKAA